jgi:hypothetical protein
VVGDGENEDVVRILDVIVDGIRESSKPDTPIWLAEEQPPSRVRRDSFNVPLNFCFEIDPEPRPAPPVPVSSVAVFLGGQAMKADLHAGYLERLSLVSKLGPGHRRRRIFPGILQPTVQLDGQLVVPKFRLFGRQRREQRFSNDGAVALG